jgi:hypothetical protein
MNQTIRSEIQEVFRPREPARRPLFRSELDAVVFAIAALYTETPEFAAQLEADLRNAPRLTLEQGRERWARWQREQGKEV